ncbi:MAG: hypothetical protein HY455_00770 [Parcubacteria group bacterium]|nr:hypothetical protein [Parcubacteria group bacterium]
MQHPFALNEDGRRNIVAWLILLVVLIVVAWYTLIRDSVPLPIETGTLFTKDEKLHVLQAISERSQDNGLTRADKQAILESIARDKERTAQE